MRRSYDVPRPALDAGGVRYAAAQVRADLEMLDRDAPLLVATALVVETGLRWLTTMQRLTRLTRLRALGQKPT